MILTFFILAGGAEGDRTPDLMTARRSSRLHPKGLNPHNILTYLQVIVNPVCRQERQKRLKIRIF